MGQQIIYVIQKPKGQRLQPERHAQDSRRAADVLRDYPDLQPANNVADNIVPMPYGAIRPD